MTGEQRAEGDRARRLRLSGRPRREPGRIIPIRRFDYVILSQTLQETRNPLEVSARCCASAATPSWRSRTSGIGGCARLICRAAAPRRPRLFPYEWYDSPNIHFLTVLDFEELVQSKAGKSNGACICPATGGFLFFRISRQRSRSTWSRRAEVVVYCAAGMGVRTPPGANTRRISGVGLAVCGVSTTVNHASRNGISVPSPG